MNCSLITATDAVKYEVMNVLLEQAVAQLVKALCYKPEGSWFDSRWDNWDFSWA
jgi:hypothetical protein